MTVPKAIALSALPACLPAEQVNVLASGTRFCLKHILSGSHASPEGFWYDQPDDEWALLLAGSAVLEFEAGVVEMSAGEAVLIPAHVKHRVARSAQAVWLALHFL
jgi:cupin 2 domain-containing protein